MLSCVITSTFVDEKQRSCTKDKGPCAGMWHVVLLKSSHHSPLWRQLCAAHDRTHMQNHPKKKKKRAGESREGRDRDGVSVGGEFTYI